MTTFTQTFGGNTVTKERIGLALEQYLLSLISQDSRFDQAARGETKLTPEEQRGLELFVTEYDPARGFRGADCFHCHGGITFSDAALAKLAEAGYDPVYGARPLKRAIQTLIENPLASLILNGKFAAGDTVQVDSGDTGLVFNRG